MSPISALVFRFSQVAYAADIQPTALRNWLTRDQIKLMSERPAGTRKRVFSYEDAAVIAITNELVGLGFDVKDANTIALDASRTPDFWTNTPPGALVAKWNNKRIILCWNGKSWNVKSVLSRNDGEMFQFIQPEVGEDVFDFTKIILLDAQAIIIRTFNLLTELANEDED